MKRVFSPSRRSSGRQGRFASRPRSLEDQAGQVEGQGEGIADQHGLGRVLQAEPGRAFEPPAGLGGVAALGVALAPHA